MVRELVASQPDLTLDELTYELLDRGIRVGRSSVNRFLLACGLTLKKSRFTPPNGNGRMSRPRARLGVLAADLDPELLVFIDETWATTNMTRRYGRAPRGQRLVAAVPHGHWKTSTFVAGLRTSGLTAPLVIDGAMNGDIFRAYVEQVLAPTLQPGEVVILDNLASHKVAGVREAMEARPWRNPCLSAALQSRSQSDRTGFCQAQGAAAQDRCPDRRQPMGRPR